LRVAQAVHESCSGVVQRGPFAGMRFPFACTDAAAKCIGSYERELHGEVERILRGGYASIVNVGCAEGFYSVGLARALPDTTVHAYDTSPGAIAQCRELAGANAVPDGRLRYGGEVTHQVLDSLCRPRTLLLVDIEGGEKALLDPERVPRLMDVDMLVELHEVYVPGIETLMRDRFSGTHVVRDIDSEPRTDASPYPELGSLSAADQVTAIFERPVFMRWLALESKYGRA